MAHATILVVEDDPGVREILKERLLALGYRVVTSPSAEAALDVLGDTTPDLVLTDARMSAMSGIELCARSPVSPHPRDPSDRGVRSGRPGGGAGGRGRPFTKPVDFMELQTRLAALLRVKFVLDQLERSESIMTTLGLTIEARDPHTAGHCERLARYAVALGQALGVVEPMLKALGLGGFLHDLGKIAVPDRILLKPGPLDPPEREKIRVHPVVGADLVQGLRTLDAVRPIIHHHHERWDGSGYPDGLKGEAIPLGARILAVADVYNALRTQRVTTTLIELHRDAGDHAGSRTPAF